MLRNISRTQALLQNAQLRWCGHVIHMDDTRIPKQVFYGQLLVRHHTFWIVNTAMDRTDWHSSCKSAVEEFEVRRIRELGV